MSSVAVQRNFPQAQAKALLPQAGGRELAFTAATLPGDSMREGIISLKSLQKQETCGKSQK